MTAGQRERFVQVAYTSSRGGFGVHGTRGDPTPEELGQIVRGADTERTSFGQTLPPYADPGEVARFHRNLVARPSADGTLVAWHSAPAGTDESGRAGNVFVHAVLDRTPDRSGQRLIDTWRSPQWCSPYGAPEVRVCELPGQPPSGAGVVSHRAVCAFLTDPDHWRLGLLGRLLDAIAHRDRDAGPVVLVVSSPDAAALWVGCVAHLMSPGTAAGLGFGLWETSRTLSADRVEGIDLLCVSAEEAAGIAERHPELLVLHEDDDHPVQDWDPSDDSGAATWGPMAVALFSIADVPEALLEECDATAASLGDLGLAPYWPLAMTMARHLKEWDYLAPCIATALRHGTPDTIERRADLLELTVQLVSRQLGPTTEDAWSAAVHVTAGPLARLMCRIYLTRAMRDRAWLLGTDPMRGTSSRGWSPSSDPALVATVEEETARCAREPDPVLRARLLVGLADLLLRCGWLDGRGAEALPDLLTQTLEQTLVPLLAGPQAGAVVDEVRGASAELRDHVLRSVLGDLPAVTAPRDVPLGQRVSPVVLQWLYHGLSQTPSGSRLPTLLDVEEIAWVLRGHAGPAVDDRRAAAIAFVRDGAVEGGQARELLSLAALVEPLRVGEVGALLHTGAVSPGVVAAALAGASAGDRDTTWRLLEALARSGPAASVPPGLDPQVLGRLLLGPAWTADDLDGFLAACADVCDLLTELALRSRARLGALWRAHLAVAHLLRRGSSDPRRVAAALAGSDPAAPGLTGLVEEVLQLRSSDERHWAVVDRLLGVALLNDESWTGPGRSSSMGAICALEDEEGSRAVAGALSRYLQRLDKEAALECRDALVDRVRQRTDGDKDLMAFAKDWYGQLVGSQGVGDRLRHVGGRLFGRRGEDT